MLCFHNGPLFNIEKYYYKKNAFKPKVTKKKAIPGRVYQNNTVKPRIVMIIESINSLQEM